MELKKGMYYRDKKGIIRKWGEYDRLVKNWDDRYNYYDEDGDLIFVFEREIAKYSNNLIDLIEVGDYVNGYKVLFIDSFFNKGKNVKCINNEEERVCFYEEDIKDIITKEQFNACKYVVEREDK